MNKIPIFKGSVTNGTTRYIGLPVYRGVVGAHIAWLDATSAATITLELSSFDVKDAPVDTVGTYQWKDSAVTVVGPHGNRRRVLAGER